MKDDLGANGQDRKKKRLVSSKRNRNDLQKLEYEVLELRQLLAALSPDGQWLSVDRAVLNGRSGEQLINLQSFGLFDLQEQAVQQTLSNAPLEWTKNYRENAVTITVPMPDSTWARFKVVESPIMEAGLAAQFPNFKTYRGWGIDDPNATVRFDVTVHGFRAQVLSSEGNYYIDPYFKGQTEFYSSYYKKDVVKDPDRDKFTCGCGCGCGCGCQNNGDNQVAVEPETPIEPEPFYENFGTQLRTLRLANAATGEYTQFWGGTVAQGQAAIVTAVNRVNQIYERDLAIRMVLVANNSNLVYTNPNTDPYTNNNLSAMLSQNQTTVDSVIGNANYDIGHVFGTGNGGVAGLGVVGVTGQKARGVTGQPSPTGDPFWIDYVAHEMGHQYNANHTFNGSNCGGGRSDANAYEIGSGVTIMAYAGICGPDNVANFSDAMFHASSIAAIRAFIDARPTLGTTTNTGNSVPTVSTPTGFVIPAHTPFELTATGSDPNTGQVLTYSWEQFNLGPATTLAAPDNGSSPLFRTWLPTTSPTRVFPRLSNLVNNTVPLGEKLPTVNWNSMNFRVVIRDNASGGGGVNWANMSMQVVNTGAAFAVTSQNSSTSWTGGSTQTLTWNVAGTTGSGINASTVNIWLSTDGGFTYNTQLASNIPNNGSTVITVPNISTSAARFKIQPTNNIFFDINNANITITPVSVVANIDGPSLIPEGDVGTSLANFTISLSAPAASVVTVNYATSSAGFANPATPGSDYIAVNGTATFQPGQTSVVVPVTIIGDRFTEGIEQFRMTLSNPSGATLGTSTFVASIDDDDAFALGRIIDLGTPNSPVQPGASGYTDAAYSTFTGIGWTSANQLSTYELKFGNNVASDGVWGNSGNFRIDVPNGNYNVELVFGFISQKPQPIQFASFFDRFSVIVQGTTYNLDLGASVTQYYVTRTYPATVSNGQLNIGMQAGITSAKLAGIVVTSAGNRPGTGGDDAELAWFSTMLEATADVVAGSKLLPNEQTSSSIGKVAMTRVENRGFETQSRMFPTVVNDQKTSHISNVTPVTVSRSQSVASTLLTPELDRWFAANDLIDSVWS
jgi:hypothetical protein